MQFSSQNYICVIENQNSPSNIQKETESMDSSMDGKFHSTEGWQMLAKMVKLETKACKQFIVANIA